MRPTTRSSPLVHVFVVLATAAVAFLILAGGTAGFRKFLIIGTPWIIGLMVLVYLARGLRKLFSKPAAPFAPSARGLRLQDSTARSTLKMGRWTVMEDEPKPDKPFSSKK